MRSGPGIEASELAAERSIIEASVRQLDEACEQSKRRHIVGERKKPYSADLDKPSKHKKECSYA